MTGIQAYIEKIVNNVEKVIVGKRDKIEMIMVAMLCESHVLLEDVPGLGKTMLARSIAISLGGEFKRIQCTPDLLPNDVTGVSVFNQQKGTFEFRKGPVFVNILLADEINRATPRTQSALLESMQEQQVTIDGNTYLLPRPFLLLATQNPIEYEGTFPLPEAQLDRFMMRISLGYPEPGEELQIMKNLRREHPVLSLKPVVECSQFRRLQKMVWDIYLDESLHAYIIQLVNATRNHADIALGASPRASLALYRGSQALASIKGRDHVIPDDIQQLAPLILPHRMILKPEPGLRGRTVEGIVIDILENTVLDLDLSHG